MAIRWLYSNYVNHFMLRFQLIERFVFLTYTAHSNCLASLNHVPDNKYLVQLTASDCLNNCASENYLNIYLIDDQIQPPK